MVLTVEHVDGLLASLVRAGLLEADGKTYLFRPSDQPAKRAAEDLAKIYQTYRLRILNIVFTKPNDRVRDFADAFRFRAPDRGEQ
jgi:hypothetical protein